MRVGYVLLGLVTLTSVHISSGQTCSNDLAGVQNGDICCDAACGTCGGSGCAERLPGGAASCCRGAIEEIGMMCSDTMAAPCIIDTCSNGLQGIQNGNACCDGACGECGGVGCAGRPGGADSCCGRRIADSGLMCSDNMAPCIIDTCNNNFQGIQNVEGIGNLDVCCDGACGECGGEGCGQRPGGAANCCTRRIEASSMTCSTTLAAPCIIDNPLLCSDGTPGIEENGACCEARCETCGGEGCGNRPGGKDSCCTRVIQASLILCDGITTAPCIVTLV